jgi:hypothetical protein
VIEKIRKIEINKINQKATKYALQMTSTLSFDPSMSLGYSSGSSLEFPPSPTAVNGFFEKYESSTKEDKIQTTIDISDDKASSTATCHA